MEVLAVVTSESNKLLIVTEPPFFIGRYPNSKEKLGAFKIVNDPGGEVAPCGEHEVISNPIVMNPFKARTVSRCHLRIYEEDGEVYVRDHGAHGNGSTNGTLFGKVVLKGRSIALNGPINLKVPAKEPVLEVLLVPRASVPLQELKLVDCATKLMDVKKIIENSLNDVTKLIEALNYSISVLSSCEKLEEVTTAMKRLTELMRRPEHAFSYSREIEVGELLNLIDKKSRELLNSILNGFFIRYP